MAKPRIINHHFLEDGSRKKYLEWAGTSDMDKPVRTDQAQGSLFHEVDTATIYAYDEATQTWYKQVELGGGD